MRRLLCAVLFLASVSAASAQQLPGMIQNGPVSGGHVPVASLAPGGAQNVYGDSGPALNGKVTELGITNTGTPLCINDVPVGTLGGYHQLCFGANSLGGGLVSYNAYGGAAGLALTCNVNGVTLPCFGTGNAIGPTNPSVTTNYLAVWNGGTNLYGPIHSQVCTPSTFNVLVIGDIDANAGYPCSNVVSPRFIVMTTGATNALVGEVDNNVPYTTNAFLPVGVTGYGKVPSGTASVVFGLYGLGELYNTFGVVLGGEVTARNFTAAITSNIVPPPTGQPSTFPVANGFQVTCGDETVPSVTLDCSTGIFVTNEEGGSIPAHAEFANGLVINAYRQYGIYVLQGNPTGSQITAQFDNNGNSFNILLQTRGNMNAAQSVFEVADKNGANHMDIYQNGDIHANNVIFMGGSYQLQGINNASGGKCLGINNNGFLYVSPNNC